MVSAPNDNNRCAVIVFAKCPEAAVKTRIAATQGTGQAESIYRELLAITGKALSGQPYHVVYTGADKADTLLPYFPDAQSYSIQSSGDLGERLRNACECFRARGFKSYCLLGTDCPHLCANDIAQTIVELETGRDVVIGPAEDGGYYLAGMNNAGLTILQARGWSTPDLLKETYAIIRIHGLSVVTLPVKYDIDTYSDYLRWRSALV